MVVFFVVVFVITCTLDDDESSNEFGFRRLSHTHTQRRIYAASLFAQLPQKRRATANLNRIQKAKSIKTRKT